MQVWQKLASGFIVCMRNVISGDGLFTGDLTYSCHEIGPVYFEIAQMGRDLYQKTTIKNSRKCNLIGIYRILGIFYIYFLNYQHINHSKQE